MNIPADIRPLFWDVTVESLEFAGNSEFIISRILEWTTPAAIEWLERQYSPQEILKVNQTSRKISQRSRNFWNLWYGAVP